MIFQLLIVIWKLRIAKSIIFYYNSGGGGQFSTFRVGHVYNDWLCNNFEDKTDQMSYD